MSAEKIGPQHRARKAVLYIRQSSAHQVQHNRESQGLQYAMRERLAQLGFTQVEVIDEDLGCSAADGTLRAGFERMVAEVCLGKIGAVAAREVSRFARNSRDWQQLVEMCRVVDTLLIDQETIYDPTSRYPYPAEECSARAGNGHRSGASALWADVRARLADKGTRPGQLRPGCLPRRHHAEDPDRGDEPAAGRTEHACEQAHAPRHPGAGTPRHPGRTA